MTDLTQQLKDSIAYEEEKRERKRMRQIALEVEFEKKRREAIDRGQVYSGAPLLYRGYRIYTGDYTKWQFEHEDYDGPEDKRLGHCESIEACISHINEQCEWAIERAVAAGAIIVRCNDGDEMELTDFVNGNKHVSAYDRMRLMTLELGESYETKGDYGQFVKLTRTR